MDNATCDLDLVISVAEFFGLAAADAKAIVREVAEATSAWKEAAEKLGARQSEITRMLSAFEHDDLARALRL